jgi:hypothetical protein
MVVAPESVSLGHTKQATQFRCRPVRPEARAAPLEAGGRSQIADQQRLAAGIVHQLRGNLNGLDIVSGDWNG